MDILKKRLKWWLLLASLLGFFFTVSYFVEIMEGNDSTFRIILMCIWALMTIFWSGMTLKAFKNDKEKE